MAEIVYIICFLVTIVCASMVVFSRHAVYAAMYLVLMMIAIAGNFILINAQLAAMLQILVYAGAIMVLFLFVIMLLNLGRLPDPPLATRNVRRIGAALGLLLFIQLFAVIGRQLASDGLPSGGDGQSTAAISDVALALLTRYLYAFEATSFLLLVAIIGAILLGRKSVSVESVRDFRTEEPIVPSDESEPEGAA